MSTVVESADCATGVVSVGMITMKKRAYATQWVEALSSQDIARWKENYLCRFCGGVESLGSERKRVALDFGNILVWHLGSESQERQW